MPIPKIMLILSENWTLVKGQELRTLVDWAVMAPGNQDPATPWPDSLLDLPACRRGCADASHWLSGESGLAASPFRVYASFRDTGPTGGKQHWIL